jgi:hypothetical protein
MEQICKNCKHYDLQVSNFSKFGICLCKKFEFTAERFPEPDELIAEINPDEEDKRFTYFLVGQDFGCKHFTAKDGAEG